MKYTQAQRESIYTQIATMLAKGALNIRDAARAEAEAAAANAITTNDMTEPKEPINESTTV